MCIYINAINVLLTYYSNMLTLVYATLGCVNQAWEAFFCNLIDNDESRKPVHFTKPARKHAFKEQDPVPATVMRCLTTLGLSSPCTLLAVKKRHRALAKQFHPDTNRGSQSKIVHFHTIQEAFGTLHAYYAKAKRTPPTQE